LFAEHILFTVTLSAILVFSLLWWLLWKLPQRQVAAVPEMKDRLDLESKSRQTLAQLSGQLRPYSRISTCLQLFVIGEGIAKVTGL
jgi:hypothetical protein